MTEVWELTAVDLAAAVRAREVSPVEVMETVAARIEDLDPVLHAFCTPMLDTARADAKALEARLAAGDEVGPLAGVPLAVKDLISTAGVRTAGGCPAYRDFVPDEDDVVVERVKAADALLVGKTNVSELGYGGVGHNPVFPTTLNPWNTRMTSGGSSAGSAVAVATGMSALALGSDGGGSIRIPASFCGVFGMKASMGRVPLYPGCRDERYPGLSSWESLEHIGPLTRTVADSGLLLSVIAGPDARDRHSIPTCDVDWQAAASGTRDIRGLRVAYTEDWGYAAVDPEVRRVFRDAVAVFESQLGCMVEQLESPWRDPAATFDALVALESDLTGMRALAGEYGSQMSPHVVEMVTREWRAHEFTDAITRRKEIANTMARIMGRYDLLLTPAAATPAFPVGLAGPDTIEGRAVDTGAWNYFTYLANLTGQPAASVPAGLTVSGLPVGLHVIGRHLADATVLRASAAFERATSPCRVPLPLAAIGAPGAG
ncbi:amidase [Streptomyces sp. NPDC046821]|uniref:amidase n=1 Tax=Streptomyces sp. NPDC046821 TaxID=3154702 RepID=UPI0033DBFBA3